MVPASARKVLLAGGARPPGPRALRPPHGTHITWRLLRSRIYLNTPAVFRSALFHFYIVAYSCNFLSVSKRFTVPDIMAKAKAATKPSAKAAKAEAEILAKKKQLSKKKVCIGSFVGCVMHGGPSSGATQCMAGRGVPAATHTSISLEESA